MRDDDLILEGEPSDEGREFKGPLAVLISNAALREIWQHADSDTSREIGGVLVGRVVSGPGGTIVEVEKAWPAKHTEASSVHVKFTHETWEDWHSKLDEEAEGTCIVGWYHTHPGLGIFLSDHDLFIHRHFFSQPWQIAIVVDPVSRDFGCFGWEGDNIVRLPDGAVYTGLAHLEAEAGLTRHPELRPEADRQPPELPIPPQPRAPSPAERLWWLGWGVALALFLIAALQAYGTAKQAKLQHALDQITSIRGDLIEIRQRIAELKKPPGRWYKLGEDETLEEVCDRVYGDPSLAQAIAIINGFSVPPVAGTYVWLPAEEALKPVEPPPGGRKKHPQIQIPDEKSQARKGPAIEGENESPQAPAPDSVGP